MSAAKQPGQGLDWLVTSFAERVRDVAHAALVSSDGLLLASSAGFPRDHADQLAAITSGLASLTQGAARAFRGGQVVQAAVEMDAGLFIVMPVSDGSVLAVLAASGCDLGLVAYEMSLLVDQTGRGLIPAGRRTGHATARGKRTRNPMPDP